MGTETDLTFMKRALQLAVNGEGRVSPNPMVGAIIVADGRIIGEGYHAFFGGPHAEVNAINSVKEEDRDLLKKSTIYVTLEPCAHHGKTPPCADLIVKTGIPRVVIGSLDPNPLVAGKGIKILEDHNVSVSSGVLEKECKELNRKFMKAQTSEFPYIILKWAQSADGFMAEVDENSKPRSVKFSSALSSVWMHKERAGVDAIMIGGNTERIDKPQLTTRLWGGNSPVKTVVHYDRKIEDVLRDLRKKNVTSVMVEGGAKLLKSFIDSNYYDEIRVETSPILLNKGVAAPSLPSEIFLFSSSVCRENVINNFRRKENRI